MLGDTDRTPLSLHALELHTVLSAHGAQVRTMALAPGQLGGLDGTVPVLGPTPSSLASRLQLGREQRWADSVVCFGFAAARSHVRSPGHRRVASIAVCESAPVGRRDARALARVDLVAHIGCGAPVEGAVEAFTGTDAASAPALSGAEVAQMWGDLLAEARSRAG